jgi:hypothetical protein
MFIAKNKTKTISEQASRGLQLAKKTERKMTLGIVFIRKIKNHTRDGNNIKY